MAGFTDNIRVVIDIVADKATSGLSGLKTKIGEAEGGFGKLKAAAGGAGDMLNSLPGGPVAAVGAAAFAAGKFLKGMADEFTGVALGAKKMSDATGLSVESSSEWIAAGDDVGLSAETIAGSFGKATKAIGLAPAKFEELGVSVAHAKDGTVDMNTTLLNAIDVIQSTEDPTKKAALASQLFGKSWADLTPLLDKGADSLRTTMAATSDAQRITDDEVASAQKWQATMDDLGDVVTDLKMSLGKLVIEGAGPALEVVAGMAKELSELLDTADVVMGPIGGLGGLFAKWLEWASPIGLGLKAIDSGLSSIGAIASAIAGPLSTLADTMGAIASTVGDAAGAVVDFARGPGGAAGQVWNDWQFGADKASTSTKDFDTSLQPTTASIVAFDAASTEAQAALTALSNAVLGSFNSQLQLHDAINSTSEKVADYTAKVGAATAAGDVSAATANTLAAAQEGAARAALAQAAAAVQQATDQATANGTTLDAATKNNILISTLQGVADTLSPGSPLRSQLLGYIAQLGTVERDVKTTFEADTTDAVNKLNTLAGLIHNFVANVFTGRFNLDTSGIPQKAAGGPAGGLTLVGEKGPELVNLPNGSFVNSNSDTMAMLGKGGGVAMPAMTIVINNPQGSAQEWSKTMIAEATWAMRKAV